MKKKNLRYGVHPGVKMMQDWEKSLPQKTGRSLEEWVAHLKKEGPKDIVQQRIWLHKNYKLGTNASAWIVEYSVGKAPWEGNPDSYLIAAEQYVKAMFSGPKEPLLPLYETLLETVLDLFPDVKACPCKTIVPIYRNHVIAQIKPTTRTRIDLGFALKDTPFTNRLLDSGGHAKKDRITHKIAISKLSDIDQDVVRYLKLAHKLDA